ncbi:hypothetical protein ABQG65_20215 [Yersinia alsatica]
MATSCMERKETCAPAADGRSIKLSSDIIRLYCDTDDKVSHYRSYNQQGQPARMPNWQNITLKSATHERFITQLFITQQGKTRLNEEYV